MDTGIYRLVIDDQREFICRFSVDYILTFVNRPYCLYFNRTIDELVGTSFMELIPEHDRSLVRERLLSLSAENTSVTYEHRVIRPDGSLGWQEWTDYAIVNEKGIVVAYQSIGRDISDKKNLEFLLTLQRDLALELNNLEHLGDALDRILDTLVSIHPVDAAGFYLDNPGDNILELVASTGLSEDFVLAARTFSHDTPQFLTALRGDSIFTRYSLTGFTQNPVMNNEGLRALGVLPVKFRDEIIAVINIASHVYDSFPDHAIAAMETIASQIGSTIMRLQQEERIRESQRNLETLFNTLDDYVLILDGEGRIIMSNDAVRTDLGYSPEDLFGKGVEEIHPPECASEAASVIRDILAGRRKYCTLPLVKDDGSLIPVETRISKGLWSDRPALFGLSRDISERLRLLKEVDEGYRRLELALKGGNLGTWDWNIATGDIVINERWAEIIGYSLDELEPNIRTWESLVHPEDKPRVKDALKEHLRHNTPFYMTEHRLKTRSGKWCWILDTGKVFERDGEGRPLRAVGTHLDITELKETQERLQLLVITDPLTELYNMRHIYTRLDEMIKRAQRNDGSFSVAIVDLDLFKSINDTHGHQAGDMVLVEFSRMFQAAVRPYDIVGRYGGEEFIILFDGITSDQTGTVMNRILQSVSGHVFPWHGNEIRCTFSCGIADSREFRLADLSSQRLIGSSDERLYRAKRMGRNRVVIR